MSKRVSVKYAVTIHYLTEGNKNKLALKVYKSFGAIIDFQLKYTVPVAGLDTLL